MELKKSGKRRLMTAVLTAVMSVSAFVGGGVILADKLAVTAEESSVSTNTAALEVGSSGATTVALYELTGGTLKLTVSGNGAMADYSRVGSRYWNSDAPAITEVVIESGVTVIGQLAFSGFTALQTISLPDSVETINANAFLSCSNLMNITINNETLAGATSVDSFGGIFTGVNKEKATVTIPNSVEAGYIVENFSHYADGEGTTTYIAHKHTYSSVWSVVSEADCVNSGVQVKTCTVCSYVAAEADNTDVNNPVYKTTSALGHSYGDYTVTKAATCTEEGQEEKTCERCKDVVRRSIEKTAHTYDDSWTDLKDGTHAHVCTVCEDKATAKNVTVHSWNNGTQTADGTAYICLDCGATLTVPASVEITAENFFSRGAAVRLADMGIRFGFVMDTDLYETLIGLTDVSVETGILIIPTQLVSGTLSIETNNVYNIKADLDNWKNDEIGEKEVKQLVGVYYYEDTRYTNVSFSAVGYININGKYYYTDVMERTPLEVAQNAYKTEAENRANLLKYIPAVVEYEYTVDGTAKTEYVFLTDAEVEAGSYTLNFTAPEGYEVEGYTVDGNSETTVTFNENKVYKVTVVLKATQSETENTVSDDAE